MVAAAVPAHAVAAAHGVHGAQPGVRGGRPVRRLLGFDNHPWDVAGGVVLIREAGGHVTNVDGSTYDPFRPDALATNGPLHPLLLEVFGQPEEPGREGRGA